MKAQHQTYAERLINTVAFTMSKFRTCSHTNQQQQASQSAFGIYTLNLYRLTNANFLLLKHAA
jgi:hypothetical protein